MTFEWNIEKWIEEMIPAPIRMRRIKDYIVSMMSPLNSIYIEFKGLRAELKKKLRFNGQVIVLENLLNDRFDVTLRRIRIITTFDLFRKKYIGQTWENRPLWIGQIFENQPQYIGQWIEYQNNTGADFTVEVPEGVYSISELIMIKELVKYYKLAGKKAKFIFSNGIEF
jgi:hypothetical protein